MITLDLAFSPAAADLIDAADGEGTRSRLQQASDWECELKAWIEALRQDLNNQCPEVVRACDSVSLGVSLLDDTSIAELNKRWRQKPIPTDVLSFAALESEMPMGAGQEVELGDIVVSVPSARRQALEQEHGLERELRWLVSHGLLHLLGWDHPDEVSLAAMLQKQEHLLGMGGNVRSRGEINCESADEVTAEP
jgi:probable rRNA maturation factor